MKSLCYEFLNEYIKKHTQVLLLQRKFCNAVSNIPETKKNITLANSLH